MDSNIVEEILDELDPIFQNAEIGATVVRLLKDRGIANDDELAPYLEQAAAASSVKWRATRLRLARLLESAARSIEDELSAKQKKTLEEARAADQQPRRSRRAHPGAETKHEVKPEEQKGSPSHEAEEKPSKATDARADRHNVSQTTASKERPAAEPPQDKSQDQAKDQVRDQIVRDQIKDKEQRQPHSQPSSQTKTEESGSQHGSGPAHSEKRNAEGGRGTELERKPA